MIVAIFVVAVEYWLGWRALLAPWATLSPWQVATAVLLVLLSYGLRAVRVHRYFAPETRGRFMLSLKLILQHNALNNLLPMRTGEASFPLLMQTYLGIRPTRSIPTLVWFRLLDLHTLGLIGLLCLGGLGLPNWARTGLVLLALPLPWLVQLLHRRIAAWLSPRLPAKLSWLTAMLNGLPEGAGYFWEAWLWTLLNWLVKLLAFAWVLGFFIDVSVYAALFGVIAGDLTSVLPVHGFAGIGTYEAGVVAGLLPFGVDAEAAVAAAVNLHLLLLGSTLICALLSVPLRGPRHG